MIGRIEPVRKCSLSLSLFHSLIRSSQRIATNKSPTCIYLFVCIPCVFFLFYYGASVPLISWIVPLTFVSKSFDHIVRERDTESFLIEFSSHESSRRWKKSPFAWSSGSTSPPPPLTADYGIIELLWTSSSSSLFSASSCFTLMLVVGLGKLIAVTNSIIRQDRRRQLGFSEITFVFMIQKGRRKEERGKRKEKTLDCP